MFRTIAYARSGSWKKKRFYYTRRRRPPVLIFTKYRRFIEHPAYRDPRRRLFDRSFYDKSAAWKSPPRPVNGDSATYY